MKLLFLILCPKPELRATIDEILSNEWVNQSVDMDLYVWHEVVRDTEFHGNTAGDFNRDEEYAKGNFYIKSQGDGQIEQEMGQNHDQTDESNLNLDRINLASSVGLNNDENQDPENFKSNSKKKPLNLQSQVAAILSKSF